MDILILIDKLDDLLYNARPIPLTEQVRVDRKQIFDILDQMRSTLPEEIKQARWIVKERGETGTNEPGDRRLVQIAAAIEDLKRSQRPSPKPLTAAASEQVRGIMEAAEASASGVRHDAEEDAKRIAAEAAQHDTETRRKTAAESADRLGKAEKATDGMIAEARETTAQIRSLLDGLRGPAAALEGILNGGASTLKADFEKIGAHLAEFEGDGAKKAEEPTKTHPAARRFQAEPPDDAYVMAERRTGSTAAGRAPHGEPGTS